MSKLLELLLVVVVCFPLFFTPPKMGFCGSVFLENI